MALRNLVNKECGGNNPMIDVAQQFTTNRLDPGWQHDESKNVSHQVELASGSSAFHMGSILQSIEHSQMSVASGTQQQSRPLMQTTLSGPVLAPHQASQQATLPNQTDMTYSHKPFNFQPPPMMPFNAPPSMPLVHHQAPFMMHRVPTMGPLTAPQQDTTSPADFLDDFHRAEKAKEKQDEMRESFDVTSFPQEAREFIEQAKNDKQITNSEFANFIEKIANGEIQVTEDGQLIVDMTESEKWAEEFTTTEVKSSQNTEKEKPLEPVKPVVTEQPTDHFPSFSSEKYEHEYEFSRDNPHTEVDNPFEEGLKKLEAGDIPSAVLFFEAAVQKDPSEYLYWQYLGTTQAQNEHDDQAIKALEECVKLKPDNLVGLMTLAASFANKNRGQDAATYLSKWLNANPKYNFPVVEGRPPSRILDAVRESFLQAARQQPNPPDADVQCGLGILFNCVGDFKKAVDCFRAALVVRPNEASLWNRLGASYANGDFPKEAIDSYERALQISPGYLRCRANLGITCINQRKYEEAIVHFLTVLNIQNAGRGKSGQPAGKNSMSHHLWTNVRMVLGLLNKQILYRFVTDRDLDSLNQHFGISPSDLLLQPPGSSKKTEESS